MACCDPLRNEPILSVEFEVFGKVQGCYFPKHVRDLCQQLGICGWVKNTKRGTIVGKMQGPESLVEQMTKWVANEGSPDSQIHHCEFTNIEHVTRVGYKKFEIRF